MINNEEYPSDICDVQKMLSVDKGLQELIEFDNLVLYQYMIKLLERLKIAVDTSPMVYL